MSGNDGFLYPVPSDTDPHDGRLRDPTTADGAGSVTGFGALSADSATVVGAGISSSAGSGALTAGASAVSGAGETSGAGTGVLLAQDAAVAGAGISSSSGTGALAADAASLIGVGESSSLGSGTPTAQAAVVSGAGVAKWVAGSDDTFLLENGTDHYLLEDGSGRYRREEIALAAAAAQVSGAGVSTSSGSGDLASGEAAVAGIGVAVGAAAEPIVEPGRAGGGGGFYSSGPPQRWAKFNARARPVEITESRRDRAHADGSTIVPALRARVSEQFEDTAQGAGHLAATGQGVVVELRMDICRARGRTRNDEDDAMAAMRALLPLLKRTA